jgi:hypothetical protein
MLKHSDSYEAGSFSGPEKGFKRENINVCQVLRYLFINQSLITYGILMRAQRRSWYARLSHRMTVMLAGFVNSADRTNISMSLNAGCGIEVFTRTVAALAGSSLFTEGSRH